MPHARSREAVLPESAIATTFDPPVRAVSLKQVVEQTNLSKAYIYSLISKGQFPPPAKVGRKSLWPSNEIDDWLRSRFADRPAEQSLSPTSRVALPGSRLYSRRRS